MRKIDWLASYPKSGSTWVRCLVGAYLSGSCNPNHLPHAVSQSDLKTYQYQLVSPCDLGLLHPSSVLGMRGAVLEHLRVGPWSLVKTHHARMRIEDVTLIPNRVTNRAIYLVRDPRDIAASFSAHTAMEMDDVVSMMGERLATLNKSVSSMVHVLSSWSLHVDSWMRSDFPVLCVKYETLRSRPDEMLGKIMDFLGFDVDDARIQSAVESASMESLKFIEQSDGFREAKNGVFFGGEREPLTAEQRDKIESDHGEVMRAMEYLT